MAIFYNSCPKNVGSRKESESEEEKYDEFEVMRIKNFQTSLCLDSNYDGFVYTRACNGGSFQRWIIHQLKQNRVKLENLATGLYLSVSFDDKFTTISSNFTFQRRMEWYVTHVSLCKSK